MSRKQITRIEAERLVSKLEKDKNLKSFINLVSYNCWWYGKFGSRNRELFTQYLKDLIEEKGIRIF